MSASATRNTGIAVWILGLFLPLALNSAWVSVAAIFAIYGIVALSETSFSAAPACSTWGTPSISASAPMSRRS